MRRSSTEADRDPREPLFRFKRCLVHFAVGNEKVSMTTHLEGAETRFFPFNQGVDNPVNPDGHKVAYLWEDILQPDNLMDLINNFIHEAGGDGHGLRPRARRGERAEASGARFPTLPPTRRDS